MTLSLISKSLNHDGIIFPVSIRALGLYASTYRMLTSEKIGNEAFSSLMCAANAQAPCGGFSIAEANHEATHRFGLNRRG